MKVSSKWMVYQVLLVFCVIILAGCTFPDLSERTFTFRPSKTASIMVTDLERFGICDPFFVDRRGASFFMWGEFLRERGYSRFETPAELSGFEVLIQRGETCHLRTVNFFQAAAHFDLDSLPSSAIVSAELTINNINYGGLDAPVGFGSTSQCRQLILGQADEFWDAGTFYNAPPGEGDGARELITWIPARYDSGPYRTLPASLDVTKTVSDWARGIHTNNGFVISPDTEAVLRLAESVEEGGYYCPLWLDSFELTVTVASSDS
jgi:hypothetical protein